VRAVLADASALVAFLDRDDREHGRCVQALKALHDPLVTVWPALTEAVHLLSGMPRGTAALCDMVDDGLLGLVALEATDFSRMKELMAKYRDLPMDFADAALVRAAEREGLTRIITFDAHFLVYRLPQRKRLTVLP
jgi:predicted nucleic acid-binding protein